MKESVILLALPFKNEKLCMVTKRQCIKANYFFCLFFKKREKLILTFIDVILGSNVTGVNQLMLHPTGYFYKEVELRWHIEEDDLPYSCLQQSSCIALIHTFSKFHYWIPMGSSGASIQYVLWCKTKKLKWIPGLCLKDLQLMQNISGQVVNEGALRNTTSSFLI